MPQTTTELASPQIVQTADGSPTLYSPQTAQHYHSVHGARQESLHIFLDCALSHRLERPLSGDVHILEVGFGTGLNALLSWERARALGAKMHYTTLELYPIEAEVYRKLGYQVAEGALPDDALSHLHEALWGEVARMDELFSLEKRRMDLRDFSARETYDVIYFDAFSPEAQPELWEQEIFARLYEASRAGAVLSTYCAKGAVRRALQSVGFVVERLPGPPGKREILRASKV